MNRKAFIKNSVIAGGEHRYTNFMSAQLNMITMTPATKINSIAIMPLMKGCLKIMPVVIFLTR